LAHLGDHRLRIDPLGGPALVPLGGLVALVLLQAQTVVARLAHEAVLAHPHRQPPQEAQVGLDRRRCQMRLLPDLHHGVDVLLPEVARVRHRLEARLLLQVAEEAPQKLRAFLPRLVRDGFLQRGVLGVEEFDQDLQHLERHLARLVAGEDFLWGLARPTLGASGLLLAGTPGAGGFLLPAARCAVNGVAGDCVRHGDGSWFDARRPNGKPVLAMKVESRAVPGGTDSVAHAGQWSRTSAPRATTASRHLPRGFVGQRVCARQLGRS
jgi:hypothetical protein